MHYIMHPYDNALQEIMQNGSIKSNKRTGVQTKSVFGLQRRYRLDKRFPVVTRRKVWPKSIFAELLWFLSGSTNNKDLQALGSNIWTPWVDSEFEKKHGYAEGCLGPVYGFQLRHFDGEYGNGIGGHWRSDKDHIMIGDQSGSLYGLGGFDQLLYMVNRIKEDPTCRRILFDLWNPKNLNEMRLACCHYSFQICIDDDRLMTGVLTMRSGDYFIGCCANIQFYAALTMMFAQQTECHAFELVHTVGDAHIYSTHFSAVKNYLNTPIIDSPILNIKKAKDITSYTMEDFELNDFRSGPVISAPVSV